MGKNSQHREYMKSQKNSILGLIDDELYQVEVHDGTQGKDWGVFVFVNGIKLEWNWSSVCIKVGFGSTVSDLDAIQNLFEKNGHEVSRTKKGNLVSLYLNTCIVQNFIEVYDLLTKHDIQLEKKFRVGYGENKKGVDFFGTVFQNTKERGATIGGMFGKMVCEVSGMNRDFVLPEFHTRNFGEIDAVEVCPQTEKPISIYECQSGIHYGNFLDENHLNKATNRYLYAEEIIETVKKIVILAGGYSRQTKNILLERSIELANRENPIELILLKTKRVDNKISVVREML